LAVTFSVLVVANRTADSPELLEALRARAERGPVRFTLLAPASTGREATARQLEAGLEVMRAAGLEVDGRIGDRDPTGAVTDAWDPGEFDEIIVSTLPAQTSKWLSINLPQRVAKLTDALVTHVVASETASPPPSVAQSSETE
jgi:hypothetical protein